MNEIKFRGKVINDVECYGELLFRKGEWVYGYLVSPNVIVGDVVEIDEEYISFEWWVTVDPVTVGQSTDLKDKNGKEIYEGDVVKWQPKEPFEAEFIMPVVFHNGCFATVSCCGHTQLCWCGYIKDGLEIIGNIYENPELLKGGK